MAAPPLAAWIIDQQAMTLAADAIAPYRA